MVMTDEGNSEQELIGRISLKFVATRRDPRIDITQSGNPSDETGIGTDSGDDDRRR